MSEFTGQTPIDLRDDGLLWLINRVVFHPRGFALAVDTETGEFSLLGDGSEVWYFAQDADDEMFPLAEAALERARRTNAPAADA